MMQSKAVKQKPHGRLPRWMRMDMPRGERYARMKNLVTKNNLHTICVSGNCPNIGECWNKGTATFMILGDICTRSCKFCGVKTGKPLPIDINEPQRIAEAVKIMQLTHCVITSVDRDDLPDRGAEIWAMTIKAIKKQCPGTTLEVLIPDFQGKKDNIQKIINEEPEIISHNLETVRRLTPEIRSAAKYSRSLEVLKFIYDSGATSKSGIMLGLGEIEQEVITTMDDLLRVGCKIMTLGQYLQPTLQHMPVVEYIAPEIFYRYKRLGLQKGFRFVESGPLVRSSYCAEKHVKTKTK